MFHFSELSWRPRVDCRDLRLVEIYMDLLWWLLLWNLSWLDRNFCENLPSTLQVVEVVSRIFANVRVFSWAYFSHLSQYLVRLCLVDIFYLFKQRLLKGKVLNLLFVHLNQLLVPLKFP